MHKYKIIEIKLGVAVSNNEKKLKDFWKFIKQSKNIKNNKLLDIFWNL